MTQALGRLLAVDDEPQILRGLRPALVAEGYVVETATSADMALRKLASDPYDLVILDLGLPDLDGKSLIGRLRDWSDAPVIVLSARQLEYEKIAALDAGADDYVNKPIGIDELMARIRRNLRWRARHGELNTRLKVGEIDIDLFKREVRLEGEPIAFTHAEFDLFSTLARFHGQVVTYRQAIAAVWGASDRPNSQSVRSLIAQVRHRIEADPSKPELVVTLVGGYALVTPPPAP